MCMIILYLLYSRKGVIAILGNSEESFEAVTAF